MSGERDSEINRAIAHQELLYPNKSRQLRSSRGFSSSIRSNRDLLLPNYNFTSRHLEQVEGIQAIVLALPKDGPERASQIADLLRAYGAQYVYSAWFDLLDANVVQSPEGKKFLDNSTLIFEGAEREYQELHETQGMESIYGEYAAPSYNSMPLMSNLYKKVSGKDYETPEQLREFFSQALQGKKILEIASGPGWLMKVLKDLGAKISGVEKNTRYSYVAKAWGLNIKFGDAADVDKKFDTEFDIVISNNLLSMHILDEDKSKGENILKSSNSVLKPGGLSLHCIDYRVLPKELACIAELASGDGTTDPTVDDFTEMMEYLDGLPPEQQLTFQEIAEPAISRELLEQVGDEVEFLDKDGSIVMSYYKK